MYIETTKEFAKDVTFKFDFKPGPKCNNDIFFRGTKFDIVPDKENQERQGRRMVHIRDRSPPTTRSSTRSTARRSAPKDAKGKGNTLILRAEFGAIEIKNIRVKE